MKRPCAANPPRLFCAVPMPLVAIALGVASGGFACFYHGGTYYEAFPGQKAEQVAPYCQDYLTQVGL